jgi:8-oxo-dGTP pyrophosphatase MutT (NUDIX family)
MNLDEIRKQVDACLHMTDGALMKSRELITDLLDHSPEPLSRRQFTPGHITCTGLVLHPSLDSVLLVHHLRLNRWLLPGGHVESEDATLQQAARREVLEETSADLSREFESFLIGVDVHGIPPKRGEPLHLHHDFIFGFKARSDAVACSPESREVAWCAVNEFDRYDVPSNVRLAFERFIRTLR